MFNCRATPPAPPLPHHCPPPPPPSALRLQGAAKKTLASAVGFLRDLSHTASNLYHKRSDDEEEDAEYLKVRGEGQRMAREGWGQVLFRSGWVGALRCPPQTSGGTLHCSLACLLNAAAAAPHLSTPQVRAYVHELERHLGEAHRQAARLVRHQVRSLVNGGRRFAGAAAEAA